MKSGQRRKTFTPTREQENRRRDYLVESNKPFPAWRHRIYTGAIWAGTLIPRQLTDDSAQHCLDMALLADRIHRRQSIEYTGIYTHGITTEDIEALETA